MAINFQNACILSFWKLFQCFQKIWKINTTLFPKIVLIFLKSLCGSQNGFPNLESGSEPIAPPHYWTSAALCSVRGERNSKSSGMKMTVTDLTPTWHHQLVEISQQKKIDCRTGPNWIGYYGSDQSKMEGEVDFQSWFLRDEERKSKSEKKRLGVFVWSPCIPIFRSIAQ